MRGGEQKCAFLIEQMPAFRRRRNAPRTMKRRNGAPPCRGVALIVMHKRMNNGTRKNNSNKNKSNKNKNKNKKTKKAARK